MEYSLLDPKTDFIFKLIFGNEKHPEILISFLNAVIKPVNKITAVKIDNTDLEKKHIEDKFSRLDVKATTSNNEIVNIEIQLKDEKNMIKRSLYYLSKMYVNQLGSGENYNILPRTVAINILRFNYLDNEENYHNAYRFKNLKNDKELTDVMEIHFIELPKFDENKEGKLLIENLKKLDMLKAWTLFLKEPTNEHILELEENIKELKEAKKELTVISADKKNRMLYEMREASLHDRVSALEGAEEKGYNKALKEIQEAKKREEEAKKREEKAKKEKEKEQKEKEKAKKQVVNLVKLLLDTNTAIEKISETTKLSIDEIKNIKNI